MGKCIKCGVRFVGIPEHPIPDHLCKACEITDLKKQLAEWKEKAENCNRIAGDNFKIADGLMGERNELEKQLTAERAKSAKLIKALEDAVKYLKSFAISGKYPALSKAIKEYDIIIIGEDKL